MTDAERLRARGIPVQLADSRICMLKFDWAALADVEDKHGTIGNFIDRFSAGGYRAILNGLTAGLAHDLKPSEVLSLLDTADILKYRGALDQAVAQALPKPEPTEDDAGKASGETAANSPGSTSTATPSSGPASAQASSGQ